MKKNKHVNLVLIVFFMVIIFLISLPGSLYGELYRKGLELFSPYQFMKEEDIVSMMRKNKASDLLREIIELEKGLPTVEDQMAILPHLMALMEKKDEFTELELLRLVKEKETRAGLESSLVRMYLDKGANSTDLLPLLKDEGVTQNTKEYIVSVGKFSAAELTDIFSYHDDSISIIAMKCIAPIDSNLALELAAPILLSNNKSFSDEKIIASFLGVARYFESHSDDEQKQELGENLKEEITNAMKELYQSSSNQLLKDQAIYALARMADYDLFTYIIDSNDIDFDLKVSAIERNVDIMIKRISSARFYADIKTIITAMRLHPIIEIGEALESSLDEKDFFDKKELIELIAFIKNNGIRGVKKNEEM